MSKGFGKPPKIKGHHTRVTVKEPIAIYRVIDGKYYPCNDPFCSLYERILDFNVGMFLGKCDAEMRDGYYVANHWTMTGFYTHTDVYNDMLSQLRARGYID